ncbi:MAG: hypothetical protein Q7V58_04625 [Actinomycetota bacterium]|nr:hypothetical protein [Actinomycetota bacterium]
MTRPLGIMLAAVVASVALLWLVPPVGFAAAILVLVLIPPWGRSLAERAVISGVVVVGVVAALVPRAGPTPVTAESAKVLLTLVVIGSVALRLVPALRNSPIPRPALPDALVLALGVASGWWLASAYVGRAAADIVSGLYFSGWDNQAHFTTFANTYEVGSTTWPTAGGGIAWNQWYPSLHTTVWALAELASSAGGSLLSRADLLWPYVLWSATSFALCLAALAWVAGDLAARFAKPGSAWARPLAIGAFAVFGLLGSPAFLFNAGFTNFMMGVTVVVVVSYLSARNLGSARRLGWFLVPLGAWAVVGLWTPLALGLVPAGVVVLIALLRHRRWAGLSWLGLTLLLAAFLVTTQTAAILGVEPGQSSGDFTNELGAVSTGMVPFNVMAAMLAAVVIAITVVVLARQRRWPLAAAIGGPSLGSALIALVFVPAADAAGIGRLESYYVLKGLDGLLVCAAPVLAAAAAAGLCRALDGLDRPGRWLAAAAAGLVLVALFGFAGPLVPMSPGTPVAAGVQAGADRTRGAGDLVGVAIVDAAASARPYPEFTTVLWDGAGQLPNLWVSSLHGVPSKADNLFYSGMPPFPYDTVKTLGYADLSLSLDPTLRLAMLWFRPSSGEALDTYAANRDDGRAVSVRVPMGANAMCPECLS